MGAKDKKGKAQAAAKAITKGVKTVAKKIRTNIRFHKPTTLTLAREPKYPRKYRASPNRLDRYQILKYPLTTESAMKNRGEQYSCVHYRCACQQGPDQGGDQEDVRH